MSPQSMARRWRACGRIAGVLALAGAVASLSHPSATSQASSATARFDFREKAAKRTKLARALQEISGLGVTQDGRLFAHADERGVVAQVDGCRADIQKSFALGNPPVRADFEGMAIVGERYFLITSAGRLYEMREGADGARVRFNVLDTGFGKFCEVEGLAYEPTDRVLLIGCKRTSHPELRGNVAIMRWSLGRNAPASPIALTIPLRDVFAKGAGRSFSTTSLEREPRSGNYVLVAGPERMLLEVTPKGAVVATRQLRRQLHPQPEGVTFLGDSVLVIADEGGNSAATLTCYRHAR